MKRLINWIISLISKRKRLRFIFVREFPKEIKTNNVYIECDLRHNEFWYAKFKCPCGCGDILTLNLMNEDPPNWKLINNNGFSLSPSIRRKVKCESHFWIINSKIKWC